ncbi:MAG: hypothetical protein JKY43_02465 [Phycisphaerales bacterium]|nr:hypothetical protein [Phycisphaerales bacterium]
MSKDDPDILDSIWHVAKSREVWKGIAVFLKIFFYIFLWIPLEIVDHLMHTGRGIANYRIFSFLVSSVLLLILANALQNTAGDAVFLLWAVYTLKWIAEYIWAIARQRPPHPEHSYYPGLLILSPLRIENETVAFLLLGTLAFMLLLSPTGWAVGSIFLVGSFGAILAYLLADDSIRREGVRIRDSEVEAKLEQQKTINKGTNQEFQQVDIE